MQRSQYDQVNFNYIYIYIYRGAFKGGAKEGLQPPPPPPRIQVSYFLQSYCEMIKGIQHIHVQ